MNDEQAIARMKRPAFVVDLDAFKDLHAAFPIPQPVLRDIGYQILFNTIPVIQNAILTAPDVFGPPSFLHEFERWWYLAVRRQADKRGWNK